MYTDSCEQVEGALPAPLPTIVSGAGAKWRPNHPAFMGEQEKRYPEVTTIWSRGSTWGFMYVELTDNEMRIEAVVPAEDFSGGASVEHVATFPRRTPAL
jgi:hypothetical protein